MSGKTVGSVTTPKSPRILADSGPAHNDPEPPQACRNSFYFRYLRQVTPALLGFGIRPMNFTIDSIQIGSVRSEGNPASKDLLDRHWTTGFYKQPQTGPVQLTQLGLRGDAVADTRNHGGPDKALLCYAAIHYDRWREEFPQLPLSAGGFAENLTVGGADESSVCLGDTFRIGDCEVQVSQPRQPCWKIARRWGVKTLTKTVTQTGRTGWYLRVLREGDLQPGQRAELLDRPHPDWTVARANDVMFGREVDRLAVIELMGIRELAESWKKDLA